MERTRLDKLRELEGNLYEAMQYANSRTLAPLARQYRATLEEIDLIENGEDSDDEIAAIILRHRQPAAD